MTAEREIPEVTFRGDPRERGRRRGRVLRDTLRVPDLSDLPRDFVAGCRRAAEELHPAVRDEFEGLVEAGGFERAPMEAYYFARLESRLGGCTMFALAPGRLRQGGGPLVGRNYDWAVEDLRWCRLERFEPSEGPRRIGYTHHWAGCPDVLNEWGLCVAIASLPPEPVTAPGVQWSILVDAVSETCRTVQEAVSLCVAASHLRPMSYLLADAGGAVAVLEATPAGVRVRRPRQGFVSAANAPQGGDLPAERSAEVGREADLSAAAPTRSAGGRAVRRSRRRLERVRGLLGGPEPVDVEQVRAVLADHRAPICTGDHDRPDGGHWATIWSDICSPAAGELRIAPGLPCRFDYRAFSFGAE